MTASRSPSTSSTAPAPTGPTRSLVTAVSAELYSLGYSSVGGTRQDELPVYVFAFSGVGLPPIGVPAPAGLGLFGLALLGLAWAKHRRA